jgi:hypothetical protein
LSRINQIRRDFQVDVQKDNQYGVQALLKSAKGQDRIEMYSLPIEAPSTSLQPEVVE